MFSLFSFQIFHNYFILWLKFANFDASRRLSQREIETRVSLPGAWKIVTSFLYNKTNQMHQFPKFTAA